MTEVEETGGAVALNRPAAAFDNPEAYIPRDRRRALAAGRDCPTGSAARRSSPTSPASPR